MNPSLALQSPNVKPPDKGSFPLDHEGECKKFMIDYIYCMNRNRQENTKCREQSMAYLDCRMKRNLMAKEEWTTLGFKDLVEKHSEDT